MRMGVKLADGSLCLGASKITRGGSLADLKSIGCIPPNFVSVFCDERELGVHLAKRINATVNKRMSLFALLYAENRETGGLHIGGALVQDRSGSSSINNGFYTGTQAGHVAIGTYSIGSEVLSQQGLDFLQKKSAYEPTRVLYPNFSRLVAFGLALDSATELVPAFINQSSGKIESKTIHYMKGLIPVYIPKTPAELERQLIVEAERMVWFFIGTKRTFLTPIEQRLQSFKLKNGIEYLQDTNDRKNILFEGKESLFLESVSDQLKKPSSRFYEELDGLVLKNIFIRARELAEMAERAKEELK